MLDGVNSIELKFACHEKASNAKEVLDSLGMKVRLVSKKKSHNIAIHLEKDVTWFLRALQFAADITDEE